ncbi:flagellar biosynthetic protein FliO [Maricaulis salignorans]|uniref:Flagellar protein FliO/FliZ n=1 Tax=Maricaulis salignorans TaxID=144026 RepID=A0A1G9VIF0_9PROT|nr:flagellar biosynthetic protein FliO [Maricaulis salignorans]SDM71853.1 flagellar protein FliO/FliZ [Maricaulis salignorans]
MNDLVNWSHYLLALMVLLGLLGAMGFFAYAVQRGWILQGVTGLRALTATTRRLSISETMSVDPRRRIVIVRCDNREHILLLGAERETILASHDVPAQSPLANRETET